MSRYQFVNAEKTIVIDSNDGAFIPVGAGNWRSDQYAQWLAAGNVTDAYVAPVNVGYSPPAGTLWIPPMATAPDAPPSGTLIYNDNGTPTVLTSTGTSTGIGDK